jgi:hypothetical protein
MKTERQIKNAIKKLLDNVDEAREIASEIMDAFGKCPAFYDKHWEAYYKEEAAEYFAYYLLKKEWTFRNGNRSDLR